MTDVLQRNHGLKSELACCCRFNPTSLLRPMTHMTVHQPRCLRWGSGYRGRGGSMGVRWCIEQFALQTRQQETKLINELTTSRRDCCQKETAAVCLDYLRFINSLSPAVAASVELMNPQVWKRSHSFKPIAMILSAYYRLLLHHSLPFCSQLVVNWQSFSVSVRSQPTAPRKFFAPTTGCRKNPSEVNTTGNLRIPVQPNDCKFFSNRPIG